MSRGKPSVAHTVFRWIHLLGGLALMGFVYMPYENVAPYLAFFRLGYFPLVATSGLLMWQGHRLKSLLGGRGNSDAAKREES